MNSFLRSRIDDPMRNAASRSAVTYGDAATKGRLQQEAEQVTRLLKRDHESVANAAIDAILRNPDGLTPEQAAARQVILDMVQGQGAAAPTGYSRDLQNAAVQRMQAAGFGQDQPDVTATAIAEALARMQGDSIPVMYNRAQAGINNAIATNPWARGAAYAGIGAGGALAIPAVTTAGQGLIELIQSMQNSNAAMDEEAQRAG